MLKLTTNKILIVGGASVVVLWSAYAFVKFGYPMEKWGVFGDKFGALNTLFTGLASVAVVAALWHERENTDAEKTEKERALQAMHDSARAQAEQHEQLIREMRDQTRASHRNAEIAAIICQIDQINRSLGLAHITAHQRAELGRAKKQLLDMIERSTGVGL